MDDLQKRKSIAEMFWRAWNERARNYPVSFYLLFAIVIVLLLGSQIYVVREDPRRYALFLVLNFTFFGVVVFIALLDALDIVRRAVRERKRLYTETLGDTAFTSELSRRISQHRSDAQDDLSE